MSDEHGESNDCCTWRERYKDEAKAHDRQAHGDRTPDTEEVGDAFREHSAKEGGDAARCDD